MNIPFQMFAMDPVLFDLLRIDRPPAPPEFISWSARPQRGAGPPSPARQLPRPLPFFPGGKHKEKYFHVCWFVRIPKWFGGRLRIAILVPTVKESTATGRNG